MKEQILDIANRLDDWSWSINDGYIARMAEELRALAEQMGDDS